MNKLKKEECPHCGTRGALFICSFGGVNCAECGQFVRKANKKELEIAYEKFKKFQNILKQKEK